MDASSKQVHVAVDAGATQDLLVHNWTYIGYDEINYTYTPEGQELLAKFMELQEQPYDTRSTIGRSLISCSTRF